MSRDAPGTFRGHPSISGDFPCCHGEIVTTWVCIRSGRGKGCYRSRWHYCADGQAYNVDASHEQLPLFGT